MAVRRIPNNNRGNLRICKLKWCLSVIEHGKTEHAQMVLIRFFVEPKVGTKSTVITSFENDDEIRSGHLHLAVSKYISKMTWPRIGVKYFRFCDLQNPLLISSSSEKSKKPYIVTFFIAFLTNPFNEIIKAKIFYSSLS